MELPLGTSRAFQNTSDGLLDIIRTTGRKACKKRWDSMFFFKCFLLEPLTIISYSTRGMTPTHCLETKCTHCRARIKFRHQASPWPAEWLWASYSPLWASVSSSVKWARDTSSSHQTCTPMFIAALSITAKHWKELRYPSMGEWLNKLRFVPDMNSRSAINMETYWWTQPRGWLSTESFWVKKEPIPKATYVIPA